MSFSVSLTTKFAALAACAGVAIAAAAPHGASMPWHSRTLPPGMKIGAAPHLIGPLTFGPGRILYAADPDQATIYAFKLSAASAFSHRGTKDVPGLFAAVAKLMHTDVAHVSTVGGFAVDPDTKNTYFAAYRRTDTPGVQTPVLVRIDGAGTAHVVAMDTLPYTSITLPAPPAAPNPGESIRWFSITQMAFAKGRLYVSGLSNEEFASKLWSFAYPFHAADRGTSVEIFHGTHGDYETNAPILAFVPYTAEKTSYLLAGYLCTPFVRIPVDSLKVGTKIEGTTIAELGAGNRPFSMVTYKKDGNDVILMTSTNGTVMSVGAPISTAPAITQSAYAGAGIRFTHVGALSDALWLSSADASHVAIIRRTTYNNMGDLALTTVPLP